MYLFIYLFIIYLFIHYLFIYFIYTGKNNYINCAESMVPGHGLKKHVQPPKPQCALESNPCLQHVSKKQQSAEWCVFGG